MIEAGGGTQLDETIKSKIDGVINILKEKIKLNSGPNYIICGLDMSTDDDKKGLCILWYPNKEHLELIYANSWSNFQEDKFNLDDNVINYVRTEISSQLKAINAIIRVLWVIDTPFGWPQKFPKFICKISANRLVNDDDRNEAKNLGQDYDEIFKRQCELTAIKNKMVKNPLEVTANTLARQAFKFAYLFRHYLGDKRPVFGFDDEKGTISESKKGLILETYPAAFIYNYGKMDDCNFYAKYKKKKDEIYQKICRFYIFLKLVEEYKISYKIFDDNNETKKYMCELKEILKTNNTPKFSNLNHPQEVKKDPIQQPIPITMLQGFEDLIENNDIFDGFICAICGYDYLRWVKGHNIELFRASQNYIEDHKDAKYNKIYKEGWFVFRVFSFEEKLENAFKSVFSDKSNNEYKIIPLKASFEVEIDGSKFFISWSEEKEGDTPGGLHTVSISNDNRDKIINKKFKNSISQKRLKEFIEKHICLRVEKKKEIMDVTCSIFGKNLNSKYCIIIIQKNCFKCVIKINEKAIEISVNLKDFSNKEKMAGKIEQKWKEKLEQTIRRNSKLKKAELEVFSKASDKKFIPNNFNILKNCLSMTMDQLRETYKKKSD